MCDTNVYLINEGKEELLVSDVSFVRPQEGGKLSLVNLFGEEKVVEASISEIDLIKHKIVLKGHQASSRSH